MADSASQVAVNAIIAKRDALLKERAQLRQQQVALSARDREIDRELADCRAGGRVFGVKIDIPEAEMPRLTTFDLKLPDLKLSQAALDAAFKQLSNLRTLTPVVPPVPAAAPAQRPVPQPQSPPPSLPLSDAKPAMPRMSDIVLDRLKAAGAKGSKAAPIQQYIENVYATKIHDKTVGMTLYRLARAGLVRRDGHTWFIVPETVNPGVAAPGPINPPK